MVHYRRNRVPAGTYFFTATLRDRRAMLLVEHIEILREALRHTLRQRPFVIDAMVVLPDHVHTVWTLPEGDADYAGRWRLLKSCFTRTLVKGGVGLTRNAKGEYMTYGNGATGSTLSGMSWIWNGIWITSIIIR